MSYRRYAPLCALCVLLVACSGPAVASPPPQSVDGPPGAQAASPAANADWQALETVRHDIEDLHRRRFPPVALTGRPVNSAASYAATASDIQLDEKRRTLYLQRGALFFRAYPTDIRRWEWATRAMEPHLSPHDMDMSLAPFYFADPQNGAEMGNAQTPGLARIDRTAQGTGEAILDSVRNEYTGLSPGERAKAVAAWAFDFDFTCMVHDMKLLVQALYRRERLSMLPRVRRQFLNVAREAATRNTTVPYIWWMCVFFNPVVMKDDPKAARQFLAELKALSNPDVRTYVSRGEHLLTRDKSQLSLRGQTVDGKPVDVSTYRGKVVLIDVGGICSDCIHELPELKSLYLRYRPLGVEFLGLQLHQDEDGPTIRKDLRKIDGTYAIPWPSVYAGHDMASYTKSFGIHSLAAHFIVDREGFLVPMTGMQGEEELLASELDRALEPRR